MLEKFTVHTLGSHCHSTPSITCLCIRSLIQSCELQSCTHKCTFLYQHVDELSEGLVWASREGCLEDVVFLLSTGVEVNSRSQVRCHCLATILCHYSFSTQLLDVMNTKHKPQRDSSMSMCSGKEELPLSRPVRVATWVLSKSWLGPRQLWINKMRYMVSENTYLKYPYSHGQVG